VCVVGGEPLCTGTTEDCNNHVLCPANAKCVNNTHCTCLDGYQSHGNRFFTDTTEICDDINECLGPSPPDCGRNANCANVAGSYYCTCSDGYELSSGKAKFINASENTCKDIDECQGLSPADCGPHANCTNVPGNYSCTCIDGYEPSSGKANFTHQNATICEPHGNCINMPGTYMCKCSWGFGKTPSRAVCDPPPPSRFPLSDVDECNKTRDICGPNATCVNTYGSYWCECRAGYVPSDRNRTLCQGGSCRRGHGGDSWGVLARPGVLPKGAKQINLVRQQNESVEWRHQIATELMAIVEKLLRTLALMLPDSTISIASPNGTGQHLAPVGLSSPAAYAPAPLPTVPPAGRRELPPTASPLVPPQPALSGPGESCPLCGPSQPPPPFPAPPIPQASLCPQENKTDLRLLCAYWKPDSRRWATDGCTLQKLTTTITRCQCNHLTSFAVLMAFYELEDWTLDVITKVGLVISLLCLLLSIVTFLFCRALKGPRTTIHLHLCLALFIAYTVFLTGTSSTGNKVVCGVVAGLLHYFFLAAFCWMCLEGAELYLLVVQVFTPHGLRRPYMILLGYGVPALIVGVSAATYREGYGTARHCWLSLEKKFIWSFLAPVCSIIVNAVIFVVTVWKLSLKFADINPNMSQLKKLRYLQGLFIFLLHCLLKKQASPPRAGAQPLPHSAPPGALPAGALQPLLWPLSLSRARRSPDRFVLQHLELAPLQGRGPGHQETGCLPFSVQTPSHWLSATIAPPYPAT
uniref:Adhesion G protein-coupled receptor E1 n=1 Tax=Chrysemys picta bellii TaxID=8478 RepID=A0A8C3FVX7_CHRPI